MPISGSARLIAAAAGRNRPSAKSDCARRRSRPREGARARHSAGGLLEEPQTQELVDAGERRRRGRGIGEERPLLRGGARRVVAREAGVEVRSRSLSELREDRVRILRVPLDLEAARAPVAQPPGSRDVVVERRDRIEAGARARGVADRIAGPGQLPQRLEAVRGARRDAGDLAGMLERCLEAVGVGVQAQQPAVGIAAHGRGSVGVGQRLQGAAHGLEARRVRIDRLAALAAQPREHAVAAEESRLVCRREAVVGNARGRRFRVLLPLERELAAGEGQQVRPAFGRRPGFRPVARQEDDAAMRISGGDERAAPRGALGGSERRLRLPGRGLRRRRRRLRRVEGRGLQDQVARGASHGGRVPRGRREANALEGHLGDLRLGRCGDGGLCQHPKRLTRLPRLLEQAGERHSGAQAEREGAVPREGGPSRRDRVGQRSRPLERAGAEEEPVGLEPDRRRGHIAKAGRRARIVAAPRVVGGEEQRDAGVPGRPLRVLADRLEDGLRLGPLALLEQIRGPRELGVVVRGDLELAEVRRRGPGGEEEGEGPGGREEKGEDEEECRLAIADWRLGRPNDCLLALRHSLNRQSSIGNSQRPRASARPSARMRTSSS